MENKELAIDLKKIMIERGITQIMLAEKTGLTKVYINYLLSGRKNFNNKTMELLEKALNIKFIIKIQIK